MDTATTEIYTVLTHSFPTRRSSDLKGFHAASVIGSRPESRVTGGGVGIAHGGIPRTAFAIAWICSGVVPQQPPITLISPSSAHSRMKPAVVSGSSSYWRSEEHTSELQSLMRISYPVFCLKKKTTH